MATVQSGPGVIKLHFEGATGNWPIALTNASAMAGDFILSGHLLDTDTGITRISKTGGWCRLVGANEDGKGIALGTGIGFSPVLNGPMSFEARLETSAITARTIFLGFCSASAEDIAEPLTSTATTYTPVAASYAGWWFDSQLTASTKWHMPHYGGTTACSVTSTATIAPDTLTLAESVVLRVEIDPNGTARWYINGVLRQTVVGAVSTTTLLAAFVGVFGTTTTEVDLDINYVDFEAFRDWTV